MKKREAFELAKKFRAEHPELAGRPVRMVIALGDATALYEVEAGPRGGMRGTRYITSGNHAHAVITLWAGDVLMIKDIADNGWASYDSYVVLPCFESSAYARPGWAYEFSHDEKRAALSWARLNIPYDQEDIGWLETDLTFDH